jgi:hypothetical protein
LLKDEQAIAWVITIVHAEAMTRTHRTAAEGRRRSASATHQLRRHRYQKKLHSLLACTEDQALLWQIWAVRALVADRRNLAVKIIPDAPQQPWDFGQDYGPLPPWHLETLVNERFMTPPFPPPPRRGGFIKAYNTNRFSALRHLARLLHAWEEAESGIVLDRLDVMKEMPRLTHRQFEWQRGFRNGAAYYRWAYLYGGPRADAHFRSKTGGLSIPDFMFYGFAAHGIFDGRPVWRRHQWLDLVGFEPQASDRALRLLSQTPEAARELAKSERKAPGGPAYQRSVLRVAPIITFNGAADLVAPIPDLISARVTSGLFYDHVNAPADVRNEMGERFELYVRDLLNASLPGMKTSRSSPYRHGKQLIDPPDLLAVHEGRLAAVFECKARKMSFDARFSETSEADRGHEELAKGVFQLWRFFAHHRLGIAQGPGPDPETTPVLVTLDNWMQMSGDRQRRVRAMAEALARRKDPLIEEQDRRAIVFCSIEDLETTLQRRDEAGFIADLSAAQEERFTGWMLPNIYRNEEPDLDKSYPLIDRMSEVLPWWDTLRRKMPEASSGSDETPPDDG